MEIQVPNCVSVATGKPGQLAREREGDAFKNCKVDKTVCCCYYCFCLRPNFILSQFLEARDLKSRCWRGPAPSEDSRGESSLVTSSLWWLQEILGW